MWSLLRSGIFMQATIKTRVICCQNQPNVFIVLIVVILYISCITIGTEPERDGGGSEKTRGTLQWYPWSADTSRKDE